MEGEKTEVGLTMTQLSCPKLRIRKGLARALWNEVRMAHSKGSSPSLRRSREVSFQAVIPAVESSQKEGHQRFDVGHDEGNNPEDEKAAPTATS